MTSNQRATAIYTGADPSQVTLAKDRLDQGVIVLVDHLAADPVEVQPGASFTFDATHLDEVTAAPAGNFEVKQ